MKKKPFTLLTKSRAACTKSILSKMKTTSYIFIVILALLIAAFVGFLAYYSYRPVVPPNPANSSSQTPELTKLNAPTRPIVTATDPVYGDPTAAITIVEFGDFMCPPCAEVKATLDSVLEQYKGRIKLVWKDLPNISRHFLALEAAKAARCAQEQGAFWPYHNLLLANQTELNADRFVKLAEQLKLRVDDFSACLTSDRVVALIERSKNEAQLLQVNATPYFFIGDERLEGAPTRERFKEVLDKLVVLP